MKINRPKIGLALGSGGAKGLAHIGVIKVLEKNHIPIDYIAGSSVGAMIGGMYASGLAIEKIEEIAIQTNWRKMFSLLFDPHLKNGLIRGDRIKKFVESCLNNKEFEKCVIPFAAIATDLKTSKTVVFEKGDLALAIRASISIPLVFKPIKIDNKLLADGGLSCPIPVDVVRKMGADIVIAVNLDKYYSDQKWKIGWYNIAQNSLNILRYHLASFNAKKADLIVDVDIPKNHWYHFVNAKEKISAGEKAAQKVIPYLKKKIKKKSKLIYLKKYFRIFKNKK